MIWKRWAAEPLNSVRLVWLTIQIRCLEATADGRTQVLKLVADRPTRGAMLLAQATLLLEITRLKREYRRLSWKP